jgi:nitronate monooxygenase
MPSLVHNLKIPVVLAPLAGGPSTPELAAAVTNAGGLGFLGGGYLSVEALAERVARTRELTAGEFGVNLFVPSAHPSDAAAYGPYLQRLRRWADAHGAELGEPRFSDDDWEGKLALLRRDPVPVVSFTFGCPERGVIDALHAAGSETWVTVTSPDEARDAAAAGADVLVAQGAEAGGHRGSFIDVPNLPSFGLIALLSLIHASVSLPTVASGGIATGEAVAAAVAAGARAAQIGTAFMLAPEAGTSAPHRQALKTPVTTELTRAFTGRLARGIRNRFMVEHGEHAPIAYPEVHYVTAGLRKRAREQGDAELINLWAGEAHELAQELPAGEIAARLAADARSALASAAARLSR